MSGATSGIMSHAHAHAHAHAAQSCLATGVARRSAAADGCWMRAAWIFQRHHTHVACLWQIHLCATRCVPCCARSTQVLLSVLCQLALLFSWASSSCAAGRLASLLRQHSSAQHGAMFLYLPYSSPAMYLTFTHELWLHTACLSS